MTKTHRETTDGRFVEVDSDCWWDATGVSLVEESFVDEYLADHPNVGIVMIDEDDPMADVVAARGDVAPDTKPEDR
jgi:hypothetical protein